jgi:CHAT domain-containing protein
MVEDSATNSMMKAFYRHLARGERKIDALRNAQIDLIRQRGGLENPYYWAAFSLNGEGSERIVLDGGQR